ncbi:MAG: DUF2975 domain-containing protein [Proteiniphilum sp.]|nr:DUF2975 domain-containing protein [Proteiniphilum sp.]
MENRKQKRQSIALLSVLAGIAYIYLVSIDYINHWDSFANSFMEGYHASAEGGEDKLPDESYLSGAEWLFMGLIALLIANILKRSVELKEESDLTI